MNLPDPLASASGTDVALPPEIIVSRAFLNDEERPSSCKPIKILVHNLLQHAILSDTTKSGLKKIIKSCTSKHTNTTYARPYTRYHNLMNKICTTTLTQGKNKQIKNKSMS